MLYGRIIVTIIDVKDAVLYKELKYTVFGREYGNKGRSCFKSKAFVKVKWYQCVKNEDTLKHIIHIEKWKISKDNQIIVVVLFWFNTIPTKEK